MSDLLIRRWRHFLILVLVIFVPAGALWARHEWQCRKLQRAYDTRLQEIRNSAERLPIGAPRKTVEEFFTANSLPFYKRMDQGKDSLAAQVAVPVCASWLCDDEMTVWVTVRFGTDDRVASKDVFASRTCDL